MLSRVILFLGLAVTAAAAAEPSGYVIWPKGLPPEGSPQKIQFEHHSWSLAHREKSGVVESHVTRTIVMIVQSGEATLVVGTDIVDAKNTSRTEISGTSIRNGMERKVSAGDVINMPAGLPHQFLLEAGKQITYIDVVANTTDK
jgi:mannose-6-phosphate isomerase-like protein (cupin superfamily)